MRRFTRSDATISAQMSEAEVAMLSSLTSQLVELTTSALGEPDPTLTDPLDRLAKELAEADAEPPETSDPVIGRLFPNPYPHDPKAAAEYRRYSQAGLRDDLVANADLVLTDLAHTEAGARPVELAIEDADAWLKVLTSLRLSLATRLGISDAESMEDMAGLPGKDPRAHLFSVFEWLGFAQETLVESL